MVCLYLDEIYRANLYICAWACRHTRVNYGFVVNAILRSLYELAVVDLHRDLGGIDLQSESYREVLTTVFFYDFFI
jgi:hypothetical protein